MTTTQTNSTQSQKDTLEPIGATRAVLEQFAQGDPSDTLQIGDLLAGLQQTSFGILLIIAVLPAFIPIPGLAGVISGPLVTLVGIQLLFGMRKPWLPKFIARRGPSRRSIQRFQTRSDAWFQRLEKLIRPRQTWALDHFAASMFTGALLLSLGVLLALPIPFTNYVFGVVLMLFVLALLERDGALMMIAWLVGGLCVTVFGLISGNLVHLLLRTLHSWFPG